MDLPGDSTAKAPLNLNRQIDQLCDLFEQHLAAGKPAMLAPFLDRISAEGRSLLLVELVGMAHERMRGEGVTDPVPVLLAFNPLLDTEINAALGDLSDNQQTAHYEAPAAPNPAPRPTPRRRTSRGLHLRCPHCSNHVELLGDTALDSVDCTVCGSTFSLVDRSTETRMAEALQKIDRFELVSRLGVGGFGTVWKARDTELDRAVAVKIPRHGQLTGEEMEQFFREARSVAQLRHPNIVPVHEVGREGDAVFIVSDLIRGVSLADLLTGKRPTPKESATLSAVLCDALEHAHRKGIIHRDLKPSNVMIDDDGVPFLMDFGLAKREAEEVTMTTDGQIIGTPAYMSPEQASGRSAWADRRTDVYSLGVMLFELLTGELPFRGNAQMQVRQRMSGDAPSVHSLNRHLAKDLATICAKCLEREPGRRYQSAAEVAAELRRFLNKEPIKARPLSPIGRAARWVERRPLQAALAGMITFLAVAGPTTAVVLDRQRRELARSNSEKADLLLARESEGRVAADENEKLKRENQLLLGRGDTWSLWPPRPESPPYRQQLLSLLKSLMGSPAGPNEPPAATARRHLALAAANEGLDRDAEARASLKLAAESLERVLAESPDDPPAVLALADCLERLASLSADDPQSSRGLLEQSSQQLERIADLPAWNTYVKSLQMNAHLRTALMAGKYSPELVARAKQLDSELSTEWPTSAEDQYALASLLAGRTAWLTLTPLKAGVPPKATRK